MNKILITVEGGIVQGVTSNLDQLQVIVVDYDKGSQEPVSVSDYMAEQTTAPHFFIDIEPDGRYGAQARKLVREVEMKGLEDIYVSKTTGRFFALKADRQTIDIDHPLSEKWWDSVESFYTTDKNDLNKIYTHYKLKKQ